MVTSSQLVVGEIFTAYFLHFIMYDVGCDVVQESGSGMNSQIRRNNGKKDLPGIVTNNQAGNIFFGF